MKTYVSTQRFIDRNTNVIDWADSVKINTKLYHMEEYGGGWKLNEESYVIFHNPHSNHFIEIRYQCPSNTNDYTYIFHSWDEWHSDGCRWK